MVSEQHTKTRIKSGNIIIVIAEIYIDYLTFVCLFIYSQNKRHRGLVFTRINSYRNKTMHDNHVRLY